MCRDASHLLLPLPLGNVPIQHGKGLSSVVDHQTVTHAASMLYREWNGAQTMNIYNIICRS